MLRHALSASRFPSLSQTLANRGLECHLLGSVPNKAKGFPALLCKELAPLASAAYRRQLTPAHLKYETWGVTLRRTGEPGDILACATLCFYSDFPSHFKTHFEAVHPSCQRTGLGRLLFECITAWTRVLVVQDPLVIEGVMQSQGTYCIVATIDRDDDEELARFDSDETSLSPSDNEQGHGTFLRKLGFVRATHDFHQEPDTEICFQLEFHLPIHESLEEAHALPARPSSA